MSLFSLFRKSKQEPGSGEASFRAGATTEAAANRGRTRRKSGREGGADPVLPEKKRARRRLIGAVALVLAAVIGLPMILDSEPKPLATDIAIDIPARNQRPSTTARPSDSEVPATQALDNGEEVLDTTAKGKPAPAKVETPAALQAAAKPEEVRAEPQPQAKPEIKPENKPEAPVRTAERGSDAARARALLDGKPDGATDKHGGKFVIQVAALASRDKVEELQGRLKNAGIKSYTQRIATESGERTRIRIGPFDSREQADKVRERLVKLGLSGSLVPA